KGNVLDPLDIIDGITLDALIAKRTTGLMQPKLAEKISKATRKEFPDGIAPHGADALRFTIVALAHHGRDIKFDLGRAEGYKNFCNKLWNATRFVLMNTEGFSTRAPGEHTAGHNGHDAPRAPHPHTDAEQWILWRLEAVTAEAHTQFAAYRFDLLVQALYEFVWNEFCDWFVELAKPALNSDDRQAAASTRHTLLYVLETLLRLLHPLIPFVTEELWRQVAPRLDIHATTLLLRPYPQQHPDTLAFASAASDIEWLKGMVSALRRIRSELNIPPSRQISLLLQGAQDTDRRRIERFSASLRFLLKLEHIDWLASDTAAPPSAAAIVGPLKLLVPLKGLIDLDAERARLDKEIKRVESEISKSNGKLSNTVFVQNAPAAVVEQERTRLADWTAQLNGLREQRATL
ncbi:MAG TPA: class I tRNA ligase family protein, partial [Xylella sp.]